MNESNQPIGACGACGEPIHYRYPCKCSRENKNPRVITLCGSTKFKEQFEDANERLTMAGNLVISVGVFGHAKGIELTKQEKEMLDHIHFKKIDLADEVFVINVNGYIGQSTRKEIEYATRSGKQISYLEPVPEDEELVIDKHGSTSTLTSFFDSESVRYFFHEKEKDLLQFRSYGQRYDVRLEKNGVFVFCCETYETVSLLIEAIDKRCRGGDGRLD